MSTELRATSASLIWTWMPPTSAELLLGRIVVAFLVFDVIHFDDQHHADSARGLGRVRPTGLARLAVVMMTMVMVKVASAMTMTMTSCKPRVASKTSDQPRS